MKTRFYHSLLYRFCFRLEAGAKCVFSSLEYCLAGDRGAGDHIYLDRLSRSILEGTGYLLELTNESGVRFPEAGENSWKLRLESGYSFRLDLFLI